MDRRVVLLVEDSESNMLAVGPFRSADAARAWEDRNPHLADRVRGTAYVVPASSPEVGR